MRTAFMRLLEEKRDTYALAILWHMKRYSYHVDLCGSCSVPEALQVFFNELYADLLERAATVPPMTKQEAHEFIRRRIDAIVTSHHHRARTRRRFHPTVVLPETAKNVVPLSQDLADEILFRDFITFVDWNEPDLSMAVRAVIKGHTRPLDLCKSLDLEQTDADYALRRIRKLLNQYLYGDDPPRKARISRKVRSQTRNAKA